MNFNDGVGYFFDIINEISDNYIYMCDMKTGIFRYSNSLVDVFNLPDHHLTNPLPIWKNIVHPQDWERFYESNSHIGEHGNDDHSVEFRAKTYDGEYIWLKCCGKVIRDEYGEPLLFSGIMTELGQINKKDSLTNLYTKEICFEKTILKCQNMDHFAILKIDIDNFKIFNEVYDRTTGDFIIKRFSELIQEAVGQERRVYKLEANSVIVLIDEVSEAEVREIYQRCKILMEQDAPLVALDYPVRISAGCAFYPEHAPDGKTLIKNCEFALQYAKDNGKNRLIFFSNEIFKKRTHTLELQKYLDSSVRNNFSGFDVNYQLLADTKTGVYTGAEALLRWRCEKLGVVSPIEFIPALEKSGLIVPVGLWTFQKALRDCKMWLPYYPDFLVSVNVSILQITESSFIQDIRKIVNEEGVSPSHIILELTESYMVEYTELLQYVLDQLHTLGFKIAIDDFGTGYSSLGVLKTTKADIVKIDKIFLRDILHSQSAQSFIRAITQLCHSMEMKVAQEGVEDEATMDILRPMKIDYIQGFLYSRPVENKEILKRLKGGPDI